MKFSYECYGCLRDCSQCHERDEIENDKLSKEITKLPDWKWDCYD